MQVTTVWRIGRVSICSCLWDDRGHRAESHYVAVSSCRRKVNCCALSLVEKNSVRDLWVNDSEALQTTWTNFGLPMKGIPGVSRFTTLKRNWKHHQDSFLYIFVTHWLSLCISKDDYSRIREKVVLHIRISNIHEYLWENFLPKAQNALCVEQNPWRDSLWMLAKHLKCLYPYGNAQVWVLVLCFWSVSLITHTRGGRGEGPTRRCLPSL